MQVPVVSEGGLHLDQSRLVRWVSVLDDVGDDLPHCQLQVVPLLGGRIDLVQPFTEGVPYRGQAGQRGGSAQVQCRDALGEPLRGEGDDVICLLYTSPSPRD